MVNRVRRYRNSRHYQRGYGYTLGRREAHWEMDVRRRRIQFLRRILCSSEAIILYFLMILVGAFLAMFWWEGIVTLPVVLLIYFPLVFAGYLLLRFSEILIKALSFFHVLLKWWEKNSTPRGLSKERNLSHAPYDVFL